MQTQVQEVRKTVIPECDHDFEIMTTQSDDGIVWKTFECKKCKASFAKKFVKSVKYPELERFKRYVEKPYILTDTNQEVREQAINTMKDFFSGNKTKTGLLFHDKRGTGKTHLAVKLLMAAKRQKLKSIYALNFSTFIYDKMKEMNLSKSDYYNQYNPPQAELMQEEALRADVLLLDEVGKHKNSDWVNGLLYTFIDHFYMNEDKFLIITTNINPEHQEKELDPAIASRLYEMCEFVSFNHIEDMRRM